MTDVAMELTISALQAINDYRLNKKEIREDKVELNDFIVLLNTGLLTNHIMPTRILIAKAANWTMYFYLKRGMSLIKAIRAGSQSAGSLSVTAV